jgi:hypothetical protein
VIADDLNLSIVLPLTNRSEATPSAEPDECKVLAPHEAIALAGVLCCGQPLARPRSDISGIALRSLINLVRQATDWTDPSGDDDHYLCDYRFLVLDTMTASGINTFVQIWSEPFDELTVEVGPGDRDDAALQSFADQMRESLHDRGFEIGGNASNFRKALPTPRREDAPRIARELLAILIDVLGYDGRTDLAYRFEQASNLRAGHIVTGLSCSTLQMLCTRWGLRSRVSPDENNLLEVHDLHQDFHLNLFYPQPHRKGFFWEIHCVAFLDLTQDKANALMSEVNDKPHLMKASATSGQNDLTQRVRLSFGINLAGGVTLDHVRCQIVEFLELVRRLRRQIATI